MYCDSAPGVQNDLPPGEGASYMPFDNIVFIPATLVCLGNSGEFDGGADVRS